MLEMKELKSRIFEKNTILDLLEEDERANKDEIQTVKVELDSLLYRLYKKITSE